MSYSMIHLEVAFRLLNEFEWIHNRGDFMMGAIAPDAVHFHDSYVPKLKEHSHLWNCGPKWGITLEPDKWLDNVLKFWEEHKADGNRDFVAGYCVHILTDWLNDLKIWTPFRNENMRGNNVEEIYHIYGQEAYGSDQWLYQRSCKGKEIMDLLQESQAYAISGCVEKEDIERQKNYIIFEQYENGEKIDISNYRYCTECVLLSFIDECVKVISGMLCV